MATAMLEQTPANKAKLAQLERAMSNLLAEVLSHGFHGSAGVELIVQDGTIQTIRRKLERIER